MKKLILCCDGTWNTPDQKENDRPAPTNVVRLGNCLAATDAAGVEQRKYYHPGVGADGTAFQRIAGGAYGLGLGKNIMSAYRWLADNYAPGDQIFLFGFSRGAYTARSLAGFVGACGLLDLTNVPPAEAWSRIETAYKAIYRVEPAKRPAVTWPVIAPDAQLGKVPIRFLGVWDTVGSLGVPDDLALLNLLDDMRQWSFHDTTLGAHIQTARHAVAIDEQRASFTPTLWTAADNETVLNDPDDNGRVRQVWFSGVHSDVGGGYADCSLSDLALEWMIAEARKAGLAFNPAAVAQLAPDFRGLLHDSLTTLFKTLRTRPRNRPVLAKGSPHYHASAVEREAAPPITQSPYHQPTVRLKPGDTSAPIPIYARNHWNETGIFLEEGASYTFKADGEWIDGGIPCGPAGCDDGKFHPGEVAQLFGTFLGKIEHAFGKVTGNTEADFVMTRRAETHPWFALLGAIANDGPQPGRGRNPNPDGSPYPHQTFLIGAGTTTPLAIKPTESGYLFAYANDAWHFYDNNRGSVNLTVTRTS